MAVGDAYVFPGFLTPVLRQLFFPKLPTTFLACFCRGERRKYAGKKSRLNRGSNSQPPGRESDTLTTEPPGRWKTKHNSTKTRQKSKFKNEIGNVLKMPQDNKKVQKQRFKKIGEASEKTCLIYKTTGECNAILSAYSLYRHLG